MRLPSLRFSMPSRKCLCWLQLAFFVGATGVTAHAADWYVAPTGVDSAPGTLAAPFATVTRAQQAVAPGDTVFFRGGTYTLPEDQIAASRGIFALLLVLDKSGTAAKPITYCAYQKEIPVFDCSRIKPPNLRVTAFHVTGSWLVFRGLEVTGVQVTIKTHTQSICFANEGNHNLFDRLRLHDGMAIGLWIGRGSENLVLNCDAYNNWDPVSEDGKGGNTDGFGCHVPRGSTGNVFRGCRAWYNSDDGYDCLGAAEPVTFENCWAMYNGLNAQGQKLGDGNGLKAGGYGARPAAQLPNPLPRHIVRGCLAVGNRSSGIYANHHPAGGDWFQNSAYRNGTNFNFLERLADNVTDVPGTGHRIRNNLSFRGKLVSNLAPTGNEVDHNSFLPELPLKNEDFLSLDEAQLVAPRQPDGSLPVITFLHPKPGSPAFGAGVPLSPGASAAAPNLGAF